MGIVKYPIDDDRVVLTATMSRPLPSREMNATSRKAPPESVKRASMNSFASVVTVASAASRLTAAKFVWSMLEGVAACGEDAVAVVAGVAVEAGPVVAPFSTAVGAGRGGGGADLGPK